MIKIFYNKNKKISQKFYLISFLLLTSLIIFYFSFCIYDNFILQKKIKSDLIISNQKISRKIDDSLAYTNHIMKYIGDQIVRSNAKNNYKFINKLLISYRIPNNDLLSWSTFSWVDENFHLVVSSNIGIDTKNFSDLSKRDYMPNTALYPNTLQLGQPVFGVKSNLWSIPIGYGVVDSKNNYIGSVVTGIVIDGLRNKLKEILDDKNLLYAVIDERNGTEVIKSDQVDKILVQKILREIPYLDNNNSFYGKFFYYQKINNYPYAIITIYSPKQYHKWIKERRISYSLLFVGMITIFLIPLIILRRKLIIPIIQLSEATKCIASDKKINFYINSNIKEIKELEKQLKNLEKYKLDLLRARDAQSNFFLNMSHELRTPLTGVISFAELIKNQFHGKINPEYKIMAEHIYNSSNHLLTMINNLLNFSKINNRTIKLLEEKFIVFNEIVSAEEKVLSEILKKNLKIEKSFPDEEIYLFADREMFGRMFLNLLSNAVKFSHQDGKIEIKIFINNLRELEIQVIDYGIGIKSEDIDLVMEEYGQAHDGYKNNKNGIGLGLPIVQKILNVHGGKMKLESVYGQKTMVQIIFPESRIV
ncbi:MAG: hypothetical protein FJ368_01660 [Pelagibacterales bacterium]|nr:hypothetical protein [Pelagibacterales bacterium]